MTLTFEIEPNAAPLPSAERDTLLHQRAEHAVEQQPGIRAHFCSRLNASRSCIVLNRTFQYGVWPAVSASAFSPCQ